MKIINDVLKTNGNWNGAKITGWATVFSAIGLEAHRVVFQHQAPDFTGFTIGMGAGATMIATGHYVQKKGDSQFGSS